MATALQEIQDLVRAGLYVFTRHAVEGMKAHGIRASEALNVILEATECTEQENGRYRFEGDAAPGKPIRVIVEKTANATVITVHLILDEE